MKAQSKTEIIIELENYLRGSDLSKWFIGITENVQQSLFEENSVSRRWDDWIIKTASSKKIATEIMEHFLGKGLKRCNDNNNINSIFIYAYTRLTNNMKNKPSI